MDRVDVARWLLQEGYSLSALEFYQELLETGVDLPILKKEFGSHAKPKPSKFKPPKKSGTFKNIQKSKFKK
jgi:hypothetical protein